MQKQLFTLQSLYKGLTQRSHIQEKEQAQSSSSEQNQREGQLICKWRVYINTPNSTDTFLKGALLLKIFIFF